MMVVGVNLSWRLYGHFLLAYYLEGYLCVGTIDLWNKHLPAIPYWKDIGLPNLGNSEIRL